MKFGIGTQCPSPSPSSVDLNHKELVQLDCIADDAKINISLTSIWKSLQDKDPVNPVQGLWEPEMHNLHGDRLTGDQDDQWDELVGTSVLLL